VSPAAPRPKKRLGQNFLRARWVARLFAEWVCGYRRVVEVGAGTGAVTGEVLRRCPLVEAYLLELDRGLLPFLSAQKLLGPFSEVLGADALAPPLRLEGIQALYGSIPYNITGPLLSLLALLPQRLPAMLLVQREVAQRLLSKPGEKSYGRITVLVQLAYRVRPGRVVPPAAFYPPPRVYSQIVYMEPRSGAPSPRVLRRVEQLTRCMFSQRNRLAGKVARRCLGGVEGDALKPLEGLRVYQLPPGVFLELAEAAEAAAGGDRG